MILKEIKKIIEDNNLNKEIDSDNLSSIVAYSVLQNDFFKDSYSYIGLIKDKNKTRLYIPYLNFAKGFSNHKLSECFIDNQYGDIEHNIYDLLGKYNIYIKKEELDRINNFLLLLKNCNIKDLKDNLIENERKDSLYIPTIMRYLIKEKGHEEILFLKMIIETLEKSNYKFNQTKKRDINYMSEYSIQSSSIFYDNKFCLNYIEEDLISKLVNYRKINELTREKQIFETKEYLKKNRVPEDLIELLISNESKQIKEDKILEYYFKKMKEKIIENIEQEIKNIKDINNLTSQYKSEIEIVNQELKKKYIELDNNIDIKFTFLEETKNIYKKIEENNKLVLLSNKYHLRTNLKLNGISYCSTEIKEDESDNRKCLLLSTKNQVIGILMFNEEENNIVKIDYIEINKNFRKQGLSKKILEWLSEYSIKENKIIVSSMYTEEGGSYLPRYKKILNRDTKSLFMDKENNSDEDSSKISQLNSYLIDKIKDIKNFDLKLFKKSYMNNCKELIEKTKNEKYIAYDYLLSMSEKIINEYDSSLQRKRKNKSTI